MCFHLTLAALLLAILGVPSQALGCSCAAFDAAEGKHFSDSVFTGEVLSVSFRLRWFLGDDPSHETRFRISEVFKGPLKEGGKVGVIGDRDPDSCGFQFVVGKTYVVYALDRNGVLELQPCYQSFPWLPEEDTLRWLRAKPVEIYRANEGAA